MSTNKENIAEILEMIKKLNETVNSLKVELKEIKDTIQNDIQENYYLLKDIKEAVNQPIHIDRNYRD